MHKTGTTAIQVFLARNHSILYDLGFEFININQFRKPLLRSYLLNNIEDSVDLIALADYVKSTRPEIVKLISFEGFCGSLHYGYSNSCKTAAILSNLFRFARVRVIMYVRNPFSFIESAYCQAVKEGGCISFQSYQEIFGNPFEAVARLYYSVASHFGSEMVDILLYDLILSGDPAALIKSFMSVLHVDWLHSFDWQSCNAPLNQSYSRITLEAALFLNKRLGPNDFHKDVRKRLQAIDLHLARRPLYMLSPSYFRSYILSLDQSLVPCLNTLFDATLTKGWIAYGLTKGYYSGYSHSQQLADLVHDYLSIMFDDIGVSEPLSAVSWMFKAVCDGQYDEFPFRQ